MLRFCVGVCVLSSSIACSRMYVNRKRLLSVALPRRTNRILRVRSSELDRVEFGASQTTVASSRRHVVTLRPLQKKILVEDGHGLGEEDGVCTLATLTVVEVLGT